MDMKQRMLAEGNMFCSIPIGTIHTGVMHTRSLAQRFAIWVPRHTHLSPFSYARNNNTLSINNECILITIKPLLRPRRSLSCFKTHVSHSMDSHSHSNSPTAASSSKSSARTKGSIDAHRALATAWQSTPQSAQHRREATRMRKSSGHSRPSCLDSAV